MSDEKVNEWIVEVMENDFLTWARSGNTILLKTPFGLIVAKNYWIYEEENLE